MVSEMARKENYAYRVALIAHDKSKPNLVEWVRKHRVTLSHFDIVATGTTSELLAKSCSELAITSLRSGPFGGDQQIGAMIANSEIDMLVFLQDVMTAQPHDVDVKALLRLAVIYEIPVACNRATADLMMNSIDQLSNIRDTYPSPETAYQGYLQRSI